VKTRVTPDKWYYADQARRVGPLELEQLGKILIARRPDASDTLVWCNRFSNWRRAGDVNELRAFIIASQSSALDWLPKLEDPLKFQETPSKWAFQWWWIFAGAAIILLISVKIVVGNNDGRSEMGRAIRERRTVRDRSKEKPRVPS
jgi:uncharacterized protein DUF4339